MHRPYSRHDALTEPARPTATLSRLVFGLILMVVLIYSMFLALFGVLEILLPLPDDPTAAQDFYQGATAASVLLNLYIFGLAIFALAIVTRQVHARRLFSLVGDWSLARYQFGRVCLYLLGLHLALAFLLPGNQSAAPIPNMAFATWLLLLPLAIPALLIQTGAEELIFRGYMQSQLAAQFRDPRIWIIVPSAVFGMLHFQSDFDGTSGWIIVGWAVFFGVAAADLTARSGTLGPAIALHFINNVFAILLAAPQDNFDGLALYAYPFDLGETEALLQWAPVEMMLLLVSWLTARLALRV